MRHSARFEKWDINGTWNVLFPARLSKLLEKQGFPRCPRYRKWDIGQMIDRPGNETKMGHGRLGGCTILFRRNPPYGRVCSQIGPKHGDSCLGANRR